MVGKAKGRDDHDGRRLATHPSRHGRGVRGLPDRDEHAAEARRGRREAEAERRRGSRPPPSGTLATPRATGFGGAAAASETPPTSRLTFEDRLGTFAAASAPRGTVAEAPSAPDPPRIEPGRTDPSGIILFGEDQSTHEQDSHLATASPRTSGGRTCSVSGAPLLARFVLDAGPHSRRLS